MSKRSYEPRVKEASTRSKESCRPRVRRIRPRPRKTKD
jgi:hypothetical protein